MDTAKSYPKIILALGGGGARGFAHIGVLQVFMESQIRIAGIVGTSMGAFVGSTFASGTDLYSLGRLIASLNWENLLDIRIPGLGLVDGNKVKRVIDLLTKGKRFEELSIPFWAVATDLMSGEEIIFREGLLAPAIRASISVPGVFYPVELENRILVDGAVVAGVPVSIAQTMRGDILVAVNVGFDHTQHTVNNIFDVMSKVMDIMGNRLDQLQLGLADVVITPQLGNIGTMNFQRAVECIELGRNAAQNCLPQLQELIQRYQEKPEF